MTTTEESLRQAYDYSELQIAWQVRVLESYYGGFARRLLQGRYNTAAGSGAWSLRVLASDFGNKVCLLCYQHCIEREAPG